LAALAWTIALIIEGGPYDSYAVFLIGFGLLAMSTVSVVGMVVAGGRWAHRLAMGTVGTTAVVAFVRPIDTAWAIGILVTSGAFVALTLPSLTARIRKLPAAAGPPERAVLLAVTLLSAPLAIGLSSINVTGTGELVVGVSAPVVAYAYAGVVPGGLLVARLLWPLLAVGLSIPIGLPAGVTTLVLAIFVASVAWHPSVKTAFHPPRETGSSLPIPPELTPREILDEARIDDHGRDK
jgi:hypothetical protein